MSLTGLSLCSRFAYPPNSLSLCGPDKKNDLSWYSKTGKTDRGTSEILSQFSTLYPYLCIIASENHIKDPFDKRVVTAYWIGNRLLFNVPITQFARHLSDTLTLKKKILKKELERVFSKLPLGALPHHSFHVINIYFRTGHYSIPHTLESMDACLINWGKIIEIGPDFLTVETQALETFNKTLFFRKNIKRKISYFGKYDEEGKNLHLGDIISYHWGLFCKKLAIKEVKNLIYFTNISIRLANNKY